MAFASLTALLAPAYVVRWHVGFYPTTLLEVAILVSIAVFVIETRVAGAPIPWRTAFTVPAVLFLLAGALSVAAAPDRRAALGLYRAYLIEPIAFFIAVQAMTSNATRAFVLVAALGTGGAAAGVANAVVVLDALRHHLLNVALAPPVVIYQTANAEALYLVPLIAVEASIAAYGRIRYQRLASAALLVISLACVFLTFSRGGYLAIGAIAVGLALTHRRRLRLVAGLLVAVLLLARLPLISSRLVHEIGLNDPNNTLVSRAHLWAATLPVLRRHLIFGFGLSGFARTMSPLPADVPDVIYPHNILLNFWTSTGLLGLVSFGWIMVKAMRGTWEGWQRADSEWRAFFLGVFLAMVAVIVHGLVDVPYFKNDLSLEFWALVGIAAAGWRWSRRIRRAD
jgi:O-antigen ligase